MQIVVHRIGLRSGDVTNKPTMDLRDTREKENQEEQMRGMNPCCFKNKMSFARVNIFLFTKLQKRWWVNKTAQL